MQCHKLLISMHTMEDAFQATLQLTCKENNSKSLADEQSH